MSRRVMMTKRVGCYSAILLAGAAGCADGGPDIETEEEESGEIVVDVGEAPPSGKPAAYHEPVYVTLVRRSAPSEFTSRMVSDLEAWHLYRESVILTTLVASQYQAKLHFQVDEHVVVAANRFEQGEWLSPWTGELDVLTWQHFVYGVEIDPRATGQQFNHADLAHLLSGHGIESHVISGLPTVACSGAELGASAWIDSLGLVDGRIRGNVFEEAEFEPRILHGVTGGGGIKAGEYSSGVWHPGDGKEFADISAEGPLLYIGEGQARAAYLDVRLGQSSPSQALASIRGLVELNESGALGAGLYTAALEIPDLPGEDIYVDAMRLSEVLRELRTLVDERKIVFATLPEIEEAFRARGSQPSRLGPLESPWRGAFIQAQAGACE